MSQTQELQRVSRCCNVEPIEATPSATFDEEGFTLLFNNFVCPQCEQPCETVTMMAEKKSPRWHWRVGIGEEVITNY